jgi:hypothetical protein
VALGYPDSTWEEKKRWGKGTMIDEENQNTSQLYAAACGMQRNRRYRMK